MALLTTPLAGFALCLAALFVVFFVVLKPRHGSVPLSRRRWGHQPEPSAISKVSQSTADAVAGVLGESGGPYNRALLYNAGLKMAPADFTVLVAACALAVGVFGTLTVNWPVGLVGAAVTPFLARIVLGFLAEKRRGKFDRQLTDSIQMLIGGLRAGHSVMRSIEAAALEADVPSSEEFARIVNETRIGKDARQAIEECADRMQSEDFRWIGQAIQINREVGGDLAEVLEQVAATIRERSEIKGHVRSLSAEGKMSAYILMALPIGVGLFMKAVNPGYLDVMFQQPIGLIMLAVSFLLFVVGGFWMSRIVKIKF
ncbi:MULTISPECIES: type II secretion system F family protein [unclassified Arthrobacter]|uniref:type II secretion system F family protein n=1 Tax=unclassified Arthrobacter TaxID=235627 RepID=UPI002226A9B8|nr:MULTISPECIES: type II secretion system F family protein [unclassified Arthrobacter]UYY80656.1 type II secretion system F family protein [Arthrobacter sp. YA7-1]